MTHRMRKEHYGYDYRGYAIHRPNHSWDHWEIKLGATTLHLEETRAGCISWIDFHIEKVAKETEERARIEAPIIKEFIDFLGMASLGVELFKSGRNYSTIGLVELSDKDEEDLVQAFCERDKK